MIQGLLFTVIIIIMTGYLRNGVIICEDITSAVMLHHQYYK